MGYFLLGYGASGDHGSEERVRGICRVLPGKPEVYSHALEEDWHYGLAELAGLRRHLPGEPRRQIGPEDICLLASPGGGEGLRRGTCGVLWGWMPGETPSRRAAGQLGRLNAVLVSVPDAVDALRRAGVEKNVRLAPDPAFLVERRIRALNGAFRRETVGLCLSPAVCSFQRAEGLLYRSYCHLIRWILDNTPWQIALIPYCVRPGRDDRLLHRVLARQFVETGRILCRADGDCRELRGDISLCRCCVGTAGTLAGWSCGVPGLCIGASVRARGMARVLFGTAQETVVSVRSLRREEELTERFCGFLRQEDVLRRRLLGAGARYRQWAQQWRLENVI